MARATAKTLLPLDTWARLMGVNPLHFNGARLPGVDPEVVPVKPWILRRSQISPA